MIECRAYYDDDFMECEHENPETFGCEDCHYLPCLECTYNTEVTSDSNKECEMGYNICGWMCPDFISIYEDED